ncbi:MAG: GNAT family N-acetyltransferase [Gammaproteobacteria bacterium]|nr:GNAT family N-acetyltransferase [Gammaproteobacteria bacterium]
MTCQLSNLVGTLKWNINDDVAQLKFSEIEKGLSLDTIIIPASCRGQGIGSQLLTEFINLATIKKKDIYLTARPLGGRTNPERLERLVHFYKKLGFETLEEGVSVSHMVRYSNAI